MFKLTKKLDAILRNQEELHAALNELRNGKIERIIRQQKAMREAIKQIKHLLQDAARGVPVPDQAGSLRNLISEEVDRLDRYLVYHSDRILEAVHQTSSQGEAPPAEKPRRSRLRVLWILNHTTLRPAEVPVLESLGLEVFVPNVEPAEYPSSSTLESDTLKILNHHYFYTEKWSRELTDLINREFDAIITSVYETPLNEALTCFRGPIFARVFGREAPFNYGDLFKVYKSADLIARAGSRFVLAQSYDNIADLEDYQLKSRAHTVAVGLPQHVLKHRNTWKRARDEVLFLCPHIEANPYYRSQYDTIVQAFPHMRRLIMGRQATMPDDKSILGTITDDQLFELYRSCAVFIYVSPEERHLHYSPLEAIVVGMPVLYRAGSQLAVLAGRKLAGECATLEDMRSKAEQLVRGDADLQAAILADQEQILAPFDASLIREQWRQAFKRVGLLPTEGNT